MKNPRGDKEGDTARCCRCGVVGIAVGTEGRGTPPLCVACVVDDAAADGNLPVHPHWLDLERAATWRRQTARLDARLAAKRTRIAAKRASAGVGS
ncbi:MAG: hypothetical protein ACR2OO_15825 [Thermomicrobiales bacterium]